MIIAIVNSCSFSYCSFSLILVVPLTMMTMTMMMMTTTTILLLMWLFSSLFGSFNDGAWPGQSHKTMEHNGNLQSFSWRMERWLIYVLGYARDARSGPVHRGAAHFLVNLPFFLHEVWAMALTCRIWPIKRQLWAFSLCCFFGRALKGQVPGAMRLSASLGFTKCIYSSCGYSQFLAPGANFGLRFEWRWDVTEDELSITYARS